MTEREQYTSQYCKETPSRQGGESKVRKYTKLEAILDSSVKSTEEQLERFKFLVQKYAF